MVQAKTLRRLPVVLTPHEVRELLVHMQGTTGLVTQFLYGTGMQIMEVMRSREENMEFAGRKITVRERKGEKRTVGRCYLKI